MRLAIWVTVRSARQAPPSSASARKTPAQGCLPWRAAVRTRACFLYEYYTYLAVALRCRAHLTSPPIQYTTDGPQKLQRYPTASRLLPPRAAGNAHTEPANLVPPVGRERAVLPVLPRPLPQTLSLTQPLSQSPSQGGGVHGLRVHADKLTRPAVILQSFRHSFMAGQPLIRWSRLARAWGRLEASYVMYCSHALRVSSGAL